MRIAALSGRRTDPLRTDDPRFPLRQIHEVERRLETLFDAEHIGELVCSAACGADLIALQVAIRREMKWQIVLPFERDRFKRTSVIDRPGPWSEIFDSVLAVTERRAIHVLPSMGSDEEAFFAAARSLLDIAMNLSTDSPPLAIGVWDGQVRGHSDVTAYFLDYARSRGVERAYVSTLDA